MVQNVANIWPIDNQNYFLTFEHNCHKKLLPEVGQNGAFQENQHFYVVSKLEKKNLNLHIGKKKHLNLPFLCTEEFARLKKS